jgi:type I restriction enzyme S subunit
MSRATVRLRDVVEINPAIRVGDAIEKEVCFVAMADVSEAGRITSFQTRTLLEVSKGYTSFCQGDVLLAKITPCFENGKAAVVEHLASSVGFGSTEFHVLRPSSKIDARFLFHLIWNSRFRRLGAKRMTGSAGQKRLPTAFLAEYEFWLPPLAEQKRIAAILDKANSLRRKRQEAIRLADEFLRASYLDLAKKHSNRASVESVLASIPNAARTGPFGSQLLVSEFTDTGIPVLGIDNVVSNSFTWGARRFVSLEKYAELKRYTVRPGDVIVTIMGTTGRVAVAPSDLPLCISTKHLCTLSVDQQKMRPSYLWACLRWDPEVRAQTLRESKGAIMEGWNMGIVKSLMVSKPPMEVQLKFEALLTQIEKFMKRARNAADETDAMIASLSSKYLSSPTTV